MLRGCHSSGEGGPQEEPGPPPSLIQPGQSVEVRPGPRPALRRPPLGLRAAVCLAHQSV